MLERIVHKEEPFAIVLRAGYRWDSIKRLYYWGERAETYRTIEESLHELV